MGGGKDQGGCYTRDLIVGDDVLLSFFLICLFTLEYKISNLMLVFIGIHSVYNFSIFCGYIYKINRQHTSSMYQKVQYILTFAYSPSSTGLQIDISA